MSDHDPTPEFDTEVEGSATPTASHSSELAAELRESLTTSEASPAAPLPQSELLKNYQGELPPAYEPAVEQPGESAEAKVPSDVTPEVSTITPERESDEDFYGPAVLSQPTGSEITAGWPIASTIEGTEPAAGALSPELAQAETQNEEPEPEPETEPETEQQELDRQTRDLTRRDTLQSLDGLAQAIGSRFRQIDNLREDLRQDRRTIINKIGSQFLQEVGQDSSLRDKPELRQNVRRIMEELVDQPFKVEPSIDAENAMNDRSETARSGTVNALGKIGEQVYQDDLSAPEREASTFDQALRDVSRRLDDTLMLDDQLRAVYIGRLDEITTLLNREGISGGSGDYADCAKLVDRMKRLMRTKEHADRDPDAFRDNWQQESRSMQGEYSRVAKKASAAPPNTNPALT